MIRPQNSKNSSRIQENVRLKVCASTAECASKRGKGSDDASGITGARSEKSGAEKSQAARPVPAQTVKAETAAEHSTTEKRPGTQAQSAAEKPQGVRQEKQQPARAENRHRYSPKRRKEQRMTVRQEKIVKQDSPMIVR